jgi:nitronate monooxygenase
MYSDSRHRGRRNSRRSGIAAAFALGAEGVQMGTVFQACEESSAHPLHREATLSDKDEHTALTRGFIGRLARGIHN